MPKEDVGEPIDVYEVIAAERFVVVDSSGRPRITLGLQDDEQAPFIRLVRSNGTDGLTLHCEDGGRALVMLNDKDGNLRVSVRVDEAGESDIVLFGQGEDPKVELFVRSDAGDLRLTNDVGGGWSYGPELGVPPGAKARRPPA
jgi:hypothetical protein